MTVNREHCGDVIVSMSKEVWKPILNYDTRYEVSNFGRVKSLPKYTYSRGYPQLRKEKFLKSGKTGGGYLCVVLSDGNGNNKSCKIHRLVAQAFVSNPLHLSMVNHKDKNVLNNRADNLEWCNNAYNVKYSAKPLSETHKQKLKKPHRPLTESEKELKRDWANNHTELLSKAGKLGAQRRWSNVKC